ncbi:cation:proton antiporter [Jannaschia sp. LMIT008]|uniref:cation:proton antiporter domain-containing protein n=1 Tax=Jannaschia maritima TaxID=3032585 RepID=UPI002811D9B0|nr:cation:proton antiporter [Jannaschia sp. LMIT008]
MESVLIMASVYLLAATVCVPLAVRFGLGSVLGYIVAGILIGPLTGLVGSEATDLQHFAEFGVVMMLFVIGLELDPKTLWDMRARLVGLGLGQVAATMAAVAGLALLLGQSVSFAIAAGMILALSSTAIVMQTLQEKGLTATRGGRSAFSVLLAQDIAVIPMLAVLPLLAMSGVRGGDDGHGDAAHGTEAMGDGATAQITEGVRHWIETLPGWGVGAVTILAVVVVVLGGHFLTRPVFTFVARAGLREMNTVVSLLFVVGVASLMMLVGLSPALGTFLAGVVLANSEFRHELEADIEPFKGLLLGLFFITVGAGMDFDVIAAAPLLMAGLVLGVIALKAAILYGLAVVFRIRSRDRILFALSLAQAGEFGFVLVSVARGNGVIDGGEAAIFLMVVALTMMLTPILFILYEALARRQEGTDDAPPDDEIDMQAEVIVAGVGRFGQVVQRLLAGAGLPCVVLDRDVETIQLLRGFGIRTFLGDPTRPELLQAAGLERAKVLVVALDDRVAAVRLTKMARAMNPDIHIVARAYDRVHVYELFRAGADDIVREMFDSSLRAGRYVLERMGWTEGDAAHARDAFYHHDREVLQELAKLWKPGVPLKDNAPYRKRAMAYNNELENALLARFGEDEAAAAEVSDHAPAQRHDRG